MAEQPRTIEVHAEAHEERRSTKVLTCGADAQRMMKEFMKGAHAAAGRGEPVVMMLAGPVYIEIFAAMDIKIHYPIIYGSVLAAKQAIPYYLDVAEKRGYYKDLCRYCVKSILGVAMCPDPENLPWGGLGEPSAVILPQAFCDPLANAAEILGKWYKVPVFIGDRTWPPESPQTFPLDNKGQYLRVRPKWEQRRLDYALEQNKELIEFLERITGKRMEESKLRRAVELSSESLRYFFEIDVMRRAHPCPISPADIYQNLFPTLFYRGTEQARDHMRRMRDEVKERVDKGLGVVDPERYRLAWMGYPIWFNPGFTNWFEKEYGAVFVWEMYHSPQWFAILDSSHPLESISTPEVFSELSLAGEGQIEGYLPACRAPGNVDGAILVKAESCKPLTSAILLQARELDKLGIPYITLDIDYLDFRDWDNTKMKARVVDFIETLTPRC